MEKKPFIRALDVGYGNVKFVLEHMDLGSPVRCSSFPSRAPVASEADLGAGMLKSRNTVIVPVNGITYEVGFDVSLAHGTYDESSVLDEGFSLSDSYHARVLGALYYMMKIAGDGANEIDMLIVGLPVSTYAAYKGPMKDKLTGRHELPHSREVTIKHVTVFPQPLGAFFHYIYSAEGERRVEYAAVRNQMNLMIDIGFFSFDWLLAKGMKEISARSGTVYRGMSAVLKNMAEEISKKHNTNPTVVFRLLDDAIREGNNPRLFGQEIKLSDYLPKAKSVINEAVSALAASVGDGADIDNIILAGGGADFYADAIKEKFTRHTVYTTKSPVFANVEGFQLAGERHYLDKARKERRDGVAG